MFEFQANLLFPTHAVPPPGPLPEGAERLRAKSADGHVLHGVHVPPREHGGGAGTTSMLPHPPDGVRLLVLGFGGNAWNGEDVAAYLHELYPEAHVVAFHYRGYSPSEGSPSADALLADAPLVYDVAVERAQPARTIAVGFSIGSGIAARLAESRPVQGLILVTPFDSLKAVAQSLYPWLPIGPLFQHEMDAATPLEQSRTPVAIIAAERDQIVPLARTEALRKRVPTLAFDRTIAGAGHNDIYARPDFQAAMREALDAVSK